jgi:hypothetical protein
MRRIFLSILLVWMASLLLMPLSCLTAASDPVKNLSAMDENGSYSGVKHDGISSFFQTLDIVTRSWTTQTTGALLVVDTEAVANLHDHGNGTNEVNQTIPTSLKLTAQAFGMQLASYGNVTTIAPSEMTVFNPKPGPPDLFQDLNRADRLRLFLMSLSDEQWHRFAETDGLGMEDCSEQQLPFFLSLLPNPFHVAMMTAEENGAYHEDHNASHTLSAAERSQVRLRINLVSNILPIPSSLGSGILIRGGSVLHSTGDRFSCVLSLQNDPISSTYGVPLRATVSNQPKETDLDLNGKALSIPVSMKESTLVKNDRSLETVGDIVHRIGIACHMELYVDHRIALLPVYTRGKSASAGDLLRSLCLDVCGTFRRVGSAFVLTDDINGIGSRRAVLEDWLNDAKMAQEEAMITLRTQSLSQAPWSLISFASDDPLADDELTAQKVIYSYGHSFSGGYHISLNDVSGKERIALSQYIDRGVKQGQDVDRTAVNLDINLRLTYIVPHVGELNDLDPNSTSLAEFVQGASPEIPKSASRQPQLLKFEQHIAFIAPKDSGAVDTLARKAHSLGITQVWILASTVNSAKILGTAAKTCKTFGLPCYVVVSILRCPSGSANTDLNICLQSSSAYRAERLHVPIGQEPGWMQDLMTNTGESDWYPPDSSTIANREVFIQDLMSIPDVTGIVFRDTAAPGYLNSSDAASASLTTIPNNSITTRHSAIEMGYTQDLRLGFLRKYGIDPIDLAPSPINRSVDLSLPLFPPDRDRQEKWADFRRRVDSKAMSEIYSSARVSDPQLPIFICEQSGLDLWFGSWDKSTDIPLHTLGSSEATLFRQARATSSHVLLNVPIDERDTSPNGYARSLDELIDSPSSKGDWNGIIFDLTKVSSEKATDILVQCLRRRPDLQ